MLARNRRACLLALVACRSVLAVVVQTANPRRCGFWRRLSLAQASSSRRLFVEQRQLLAVLSHLSNWNCCLLSSCGDLHVGVISFWTRHKNYYHIISSVIGSSNPLPMCVIFQSLSHQLPWSSIKLCDLLKLSFFVVFARPRVLCLMIYVFCSVFTSFCDNPFRWRS